MSITRAIDAAIFEWRRARYNGAVKAIYLGELDYDDFYAAVEPILVRLTPDDRVEYRGVPVYRVNTQRHLAVN